MIEITGGRTSSLIEEEKQKTEGFTIVYRQVHQSLFSCEAMKMSEALIHKFAIKFISQY